MKKLIALLVIVLAANGYCFSQRDHFDWRLFPEYRPEFKSRVIGLGFILATSFTLDEFIRLEARQNHSEMLYNYFDVLNNAGSIEFAGIVPLLYCSGLVIRDEKLKRISCVAFESLIISGLTTSLLKFGVGRARPYNNYGAFFFDPLPTGFNNDFFSFPSGHSAVAWSIVTPFAEEYSRWLYIIPVSVSAARIYKDQHWLSDAILGGGLGFFSGWYLIHKPSKKITFGGNSIRFYF